MSVRARRNKRNTETESEKSENLLTVMTVQQLSLTSRASRCHSFRSSPGGNLTGASWLSSLCYCFLCIIVLPTCCHSNWKRKRKDRFGGDFSELSQRWHIECLCLPSFITFRHAAKGLNRNALRSSQESLWIHLSEFICDVLRWFPTIKSLKHTVFLQDLDRD